MKLKVNLHDKWKKYYPIEIPVLSISTQGTSKKKAKEMLLECVHLLFEECFNQDVDLSIEEDQGELFLRCNNVDLLFALLIKRVREEYGMTQKEVGVLAGMSESGYRRYESGKHSPSLRNVQTLIQKITNRDVTISF